MIYTDLIGYNIVGNTKALLLRWFTFISKLKSGVNITTGQYMNYQTSSNLQFRPLLKNSFHNIQIDFRDTSEEKISFVSVGITRLVLMFKEAFKIHSYSKRRYKTVASREIEIPFLRGVGRQRGWDSVHLHKILAELQFHFCVNISSQLQNALVLHC